MARNLVKEKQEDTTETKKEITQPQKQEEKTVVITTEALTLNNLEAINSKVDEIKNLLLEGFKQVGVKFKE